MDPKKEIDPFKRNEERKRSTMSEKSLNSFNCRSDLKVSGKTYEYFSIPKFAGKGMAKAKKLPFSLKVLLENLLRFEDDLTVRKSDIETLANWNPKEEPSKVTKAETKLEKVTKEKPQETKEESPTEETKETPLTEESSEKKEEAKK